MKDKPTLTLTVDGETLTVTLPNKEATRCIVNRVVDGVCSLNINDKDTADSIAFNAMIAKAAQPTTTKKKGTKS